MELYEQYLSGDCSGRDVCILGRMYHVEIKPYDADKMFEREGVNGYCTAWDKSIVLCDPKTMFGWEDASNEVLLDCLKETLRHEVIHAFLTESGLKASGHESECWSKDEEVIDWFAIQGPKIMEIWRILECI